MKRTVARAALGLCAVGWIATGCSRPGLGGAPASQASGGARPNIVLIVSDDQGYGDASYHPGHAADVSTPNLDALAASGVRMTDGYVTGNVCAPTRAGLLTGRYQQRFGFYTAGDSRQGMPLGEVTLADRLRASGYATGAFGKWHLGLTPEYHPLRRGFDEFYGFLGHGAHDYFDLTYDPQQPQSAIYRNDRIINDTGYLTDNLGREAASFVQRHRDEPFFLYLAFNAVHFPLQAPKEDIARFNTGDEKRDTYLAMLHRMDLAVGEVMSALDRAGVRDNTLVFYLSDNGGAKNNASINLPLRDYKHSHYEGGMRVPFVVSWPARLQPGWYREPVISLDVLPTALAAAGAAPPRDRVIDGVDLVPFLTGAAAGVPHERLFWDDNDQQEAIREGRWKLVNPKAGGDELYDLEADPRETTDLAARHPEVARRLRAHWEAWRAEMKEPMGGAKGAGEAE